MDNFSNGTENERPNSGKLWNKDLWSYILYYRLLSYTMFTLCPQAVWRKALSFVDVDPFCPRQAPTTAPLVCGTSSGTTSAKTCPKWRCLCNLMSRWTLYRDCVRSWSTASCWTGLLTRRILLSVWWDGKSAYVWVHWLCQKEPLLVKLDCHHKFKKALNFCRYLWQETRRSSYSLSLRCL